MSHDTLQRELYQTSKQKLQSVELSLPQGQTIILLQKLQSVELSLAARPDYHTVAKVAKCCIVTRRKARLSTIVTIYKHMLGI